MDLEKATDITKACLAHTLYRMGVTEEPPPSLKEYSLRELLDANHVIAEHNKRPVVDGKSTIQMVVADRMLAALYTLYNYEACPADDIEPIVINESAALCSIRQTGERNE